MSNERLLEFYNSSSNQYRIYVAAFIAVIAGMLFLWFVVGVRETFLAAQAQGAAAATVAFAAGVIFVSVWIVHHAIGAAIPATLVYDDNFELRNADVVRLILVIGNHWLSGAAASVAALVVAASSVAGRAATLFPSWLVWGGFVIATILFISMPALAGITILALALWTVIVSVRMVRAAAPTRA